MTRGGRYRPRAAAPSWFDTQRLLLVVCAVMTLTSGCGVGSPPTLEAKSVANRITSSTGISLKRAPGADVGNMSNVVAIYHGSNSRQTVSVVIFDSPRATVQIVGVPRPRDPGNRKSKVIVVDNVVVLYRGSRRAAHADRLRRSLAALSNAERS